jgi:haloalkane dehalogenase
MVEVLRTPDERFEGLEDWAFPARYQNVTADDATVLRLHYVDEGPPDAEPVLLLHGNPSWSYIHRHMIAGLVERGHRVLALDLVGMGRSDKPADPGYYTMARHVDWVGQWLRAVDLHDVTLYCQDWGGIIGLCAVVEQPERFARIVASNTGLPAGEGVNAFMKAWIELSQSGPLDIAALMTAGTTRPLTAGELRAYEAPFPDPTYQAGARQFPLLIPIQPDNPGVVITRAAWDFYASWTRPFLTVMGSRDQVAYRPGSHRKLQRIVPGAAGLPHIVVHGANHFIQEDAPDRLVEAGSTRPGSITTGRVPMPNCSPTSTASPASGSPPLRR